MHIDIRPCQTLLFFEHHSNYLWWLLRGFNFPLFATNRLIMNFYDRFALSKVFHGIDFLKKSVHSLSGKEAVVTRLSFLTKNKINKNGVKIVENICQFS